MSDRLSEGDFLVPPPCSLFSSLFKGEDGLVAAPSDSFDRDPADEVDGTFSGAQLDHLASCAACRLHVAAVDPTRLFALLALERKTDAFFLGFETRVMARIRESERERHPLMRFLGVRSYALAGGVALIAAAALLMVETGSRSRALRFANVTHGPRVEAPEHGTHAPFTETLIGGSLLPLSQDGGGRGEAQAPSIARLPELKAEAPAAVESIASATAQIISIKVGEKEQGESDVVLIVDQGMDI